MTTSVDVKRAWRVILFIFYTRGLYKPTDFRKGIQQCWMKYYHETWILKVENHDRFYEDCQGRI